MKTRLLAFLCIILSVQSATFYAPVYIPQVAVAGCAVLQSNDGVTGSTFGSGRFYYGQSEWTDGGSAKTICKLSFKLTGFAQAGNYTFNAVIAQNGGAQSYNLDTANIKATSVGVTGSAGWSSTYVDFTFSSPFTTTPSQLYCLVVSSTISVSEGNVMTGYNDNNAGTPIIGYRDTFSAAGAADNAAGNDCAIKIWTQ